MERRLVAAAALALLSLAVTAAFVAALVLLPPAATAQTADAVGETASVADAVAEDRSPANVGSDAPPPSGVAAEVDVSAETSPPAGESPDASDLLDDFDDLYRSSGTIAAFDITIEKPDRTRTMQARSWSQGEEKALIIVDSPPRDAGTATLKVGDNLWNYLPKISRTIRVPASMMMNSWMGSDLTNDDLVKDSSYEEDYYADDTSWSEDPPGWLVVLTPKPDVPGLWNRLEVIFETGNSLPVLARYFDRKDRLARTMVFDEAKTVDGRLIPTRMTVIDEQEEGERTVLLYREVEWDVDLDESRFSLSSLEKRR